MSKKPMILKRSLLTTGIALAMGLTLGLSQATWADSDNSDLEVKAGLVQAMTLDCTASSLSFGITRFSELDRTADTVLTLDPGTQMIVVTAGEGGVGVTTGTGSAGMCTVSGSAAVVDTALNVTIAGTTPAAATLALEGADNAIEGLAEPGVGASLSISLFTIDGAPAIDETGGSTISIGGTLTIPMELLIGHMGGYQNTILVGVTDVL